MTREETDQIYDEMDSFISREEFHKLVNRIKAHAIVEVANVMLVEIDDMLSDARNELLEIKKKYEKDL